MLPPNTHLCLRLLTVPPLQLELLAVALGSLLFPNLLLLFFPISRGSVVLAAARLAYPDAIRCGGPASSGTAAQPALRNGRVSACRRAL